MHITTVPIQTYHSKILSSHIIEHPDPVDLPLNQPYLRPRTRAIDQDDMVLRDA